MRPTVIQQVGRVALMVATIALVAERVSAGTVEVTLRLEKSGVRLEKQGDYTQVFLQDGVLPEEPPGNPSLPARYVFVVIPAGASPTGLTVNGVETPLADDILVWPMQPPYSTNDPPPTFVPPDPTTYASDQPTPAALAVIQGTHRLHGYTLVSLRLNALRYLPAAKTLLLTTEIDVTLSFTEPDPAARASLRAVPRGSTDVASLVANPQDVDRFAPPTGPATPRDQSAVYLLITSNDLAAAFQPLVDRRTAQGKPGTLLTTEWIYANYDGTRPDGETDNQTKIRKCIIDYYQNHGTVWVCFGGDESIIPLRFGYCYSVSAWPADLYYADLSGTWDGNANGLYAEPGYDDDVDYIPEVWVGRIPVRPVAAPQPVDQQAADYVAKLVRYESRSPDGFSGSMFLTTDANWYQSGLARPTDFREHDPIWGGEILMRRFYRDYVQPYWQAAPLYEYYRTLTTFDEVYCGDYAETDHLRELLNLGAHHFLYCCDGNQQAIGSAYGDLDTWMASTLDNADRPGIYYVVACSTAALQDVDPTLCESLLRNPNGGAVVYIGATGAIGATPSWAQSFYYQMFHYQRATIGEAFGLHKLAWLADSYGNNDAHKHQFIINLFGDPALLIQGEESSRHLQVLSPKGCEFYDEDADLTLRWNAMGAGFASGEKVRLDYSPDGGSSWLLVPGAGAVPYAGRSFTWENPGLPPGSQYRVRVTSLADPSVSDSSGRNFSIGPTRVLTVNSTPPTGLWIQGTHENSTNYTYCPLLGTTISLTAPSVNGYNFTGWLDVNGNLLTRQMTLGFVLTGNKTVTAQYAPVGEPRDYYVNDEMPEPGFPAGSDENDGLSADTPVRHIQQILDRYDDIATIHVSAGTYTENIVIAPSDTGLTLQGASAGLTIIDGNQAGSCLYMNGVESVVIDGFTIYNGKSDHGAGARMPYCGFVSVSNCTFEANVADGDAGAIDCNGNGSIRFVGNTFHANRSYASAGAVSLIHTQYAECRDNVFTGNQSAGHGAAVRIISCGTTTLAGNRFLNNTAGGNGGAIDSWENNQSLVLSDNLFKGNHAGGNAGAAHIGCFISAVLNGNVVRDNSTTWDGGGIYVVNVASTTIVNNTFAGNQAGRYVGGLVLLNSQGSITNNIITGNEAASTAGGLHLSSGAVATIANNLITGNQSGWDGGGIDLWSSSATIIDNLICGNAATHAAGGICLRGSSEATITGNTLAANTASSYAGGLLVADGATAEATNSIFSGNTTPAGTQICVTAAAALDIGYCDVVGGTGAVYAYPGATFNWLAGNLDADPLFVAPDGPDNDPATWDDNDYRLSAGSPCIDTGDPAFVPQPGETDLDGRRRVWDGDNDGAARVDMGAYEYASQVCGDLNCDGEVNLDDAAPFVLALIDENAYEAAYPMCDPILADLNGDGSVNGLDIERFMEMMLNPPGGREGDLNGDGVVDIADVNVLVTVLLGADTNPVHVRRADLNGDGAADGLDIQPFLNLLIRS